MQREKTKTSDQDRFQNWGTYLPPEEYWLAVLVPPHLVGKPLNREQYLMYLESRVEQLIEDYPQGPDAARRLLTSQLNLGSQEEPYLDPGDTPGTWAAVLVGYSSSLGARLSEGLSEVQFPVKPERNDSLKERLLEVSLEEWVSNVPQARDDW